MTNEEKYVETLEKISELASVGAESPKFDLDDFMLMSQLIRLAREANRLLVAIDMEGAAEECHD